MTSEWAIEEMTNLDIGDKRLNSRLIKSLSEIAKQPQHSIPQIFRGHAETQAAYRLFSNDLVTEDKVISPHLEKTRDRVNSQSVVLSISDTTSLNFTSRKSHKDSGYISSNNAQGFFLHATIAVTPERLHLGMVDRMLWARAKEKSVPLHREQRNFEDRESIKWYNAYLSSCELADCSNDTKVIHITDREGDVFEIFEECFERSKNEKANADLIVRSSHDRVIYRESKRLGKLYDLLEEAPKLGEISFEIEDRESGAKRSVKQSVHAMPIELKSRYGADRPNISISLNALYFKEIAPPEGVKGVYWRLLTSLPISNFEEVKVISEYYLCRWEIEVFFKTLKSGCKVEEKSLRTADRLFPLFNMFMIIAWRINFLMHLGRICPRVSCEPYFEPSEWKAAYAIAKRCRNGPCNPPNMGEMMTYIATFGGYKKSKKPAGVKIIWKGICKLTSYAEAWDAFGPEARAQQEVSVKKSYV